MLTRLRGLWALGPVRGVVASVAIHAVLLLLLLVVAGPPPLAPIKRGEPLFVELPELPEPARSGNPAARTPGPPAPQAAAPKPAPPQRAPSPPAPAASRPAPRPESPPSRPPVVASRPAPAPPPPPVAEPRSQDVVEAPKPPPAAPPVAEPEPPREAPPAAESPAPAAPPAQAKPTPGPPEVASLPPSGTVDIRSALGRGGGAGSVKGGGRGGIEGEPIPLDSTDPKFNDFLDRLRRRIKANWGFPCVKNDATRACDYKTTSLVVDFGILKDGRLQFVEIVQSSEFPIYDDYAVTAIKLSSPFPTVPPSMIVAMKHGSTGVAIRARFNYVVDTSLTNLLR